jgi:6-phosphogluconolactonase
MSTNRRTGYSPSAFDYTGSLMEARFAIGCYGEPTAVGLHAVRLDDRGALVHDGGASGVVSPSWVIAHPRRRVMYAASEVDDGAVVALAYETDPFSATIVGRVASGGALPCHLALDPSGRWLAVANYGSGTVSVIAVDRDGSLGPLVAMEVHDGHGPNRERQERPHAHATRFLAGGRVLMAADLGADAIVVHRFDPDSGMLARRSVTRTTPGAGPRHIATNSAGDRVYVINELDLTVMTYALDASTAALRPLQTIGIPIASTDSASLAAEIIVAPGDERVYVSVRGDDTISTFHVQPDGTLRQAATAPSGGRWPRHATLDPSGRWLLVANQESNDVSVLPLVAGAVGPVASRLTIASPSCIAPLPALVTPS